MLTALRDKFASLPGWSYDPVKAAIKETGKETGVKGKGLFMPLRVALTGLSHGPDLAAILILRGREDAGASIGAAIENISRQGG